jgi:hypothetical protein
VAAGVRLLAVVCFGVVSADGLAAFCPELEAPGTRNSMMQPTECSRCSRELPPSSTVCVYCGQPQDDDPLELEFESFDEPFSETPLADGPVPPAPGPPAPLFSDESPAPMIAAAATGLPATETSAPAEKPRLSRRELATLAVGVVGSFLIFGLLMARGAASPISNVKVAPASVASPSAPDLVAGAAASGPSWIANPAWVGRARHSVAFELAARNEVQVWMRKVRPVLIVRCMARGTEAFVFTDSAARMEPQDEDHTVRVQFDNEAVVTERWPDSQEHDALFARDGAAFAHRLMQARTLEFGFAPHNAEPVVAQFDVAGLAPLLTPAARQCGWKGK